MPSHTDLSYAALQEFGRPTSTIEIRERLAEAGYDRLKTEQVRNALTWLVTKGQVQRVAPGTWVIPPETATTVDFVPAEDAAGASGAGGNGLTIQGVAVPAGAGFNSHPAS